MTTNVTSTQFSVGELIHHRLFDYRGVVVDVDPVFQGTDEWYDAVAQSRPPKDRPWYHVLVHDSMLTTYVAERNLETDEIQDPIEHPLIPQYFSKFTGGRYVRDKQVN